MTQQPTVTLLIGDEQTLSAIAYEETGEVLETVEWIDGKPDWTSAGICDHRGAGGAEGFSLLRTALDAGESNAVMAGFSVERVPRETP